MIVTCEGIENLGQTSMFRTTHPRQHAVESLHSFGI
ncbi:MAG: hypothetical protein ACJARS_004045 [bacterium]